MNRSVTIYAHLNDAGRWSFRVEADAQVADFSTLAEAEEAARALRGDVATWAPVRRHYGAGQTRVLP
jgi:hypothetical protein